MREKKKDTGEEGKKKQERNGKKQRRDHEKKQKKKKRQTSNPKAKKEMSAVGFEPTPTNRSGPKPDALDHSAKQTKRSKAIPKL